MWDGLAVVHVECICPCLGGKVGDGTWSAVKWSPRLWSWKRWHRDSQDCILWLTVSQSSPGRDTVHCKVLLPTLLGLICSSEPFLKILQFSNIWQTKCFVPFCIKAECYFFSPLFFWVVLMVASFPMQTHVCFDWVCIPNRDLCQCRQYHFATQSQQLWLAA